MRITLAVSSALLAMAFAQLNPAAAATYYVTTGQSNANTQVDVDHSSTWTFTLGASVSFDLGGGNFTIKRGPSTADDIVLNLYTGLDATGTPLASKAVNAGSVSQSYTPIDFSFANVVPLTTGNYFLAVTSAAGNAGSTQYFIKAESTTALVFTDGEGGTIDPGTGGQGTLVVPEPASMMLLAVGLAGLATVRRRTPAQLDQAATA